MHSCRAVQCVHSFHTFYIIYKGVYLIVFLLNTSQWCSTIYVDLGKEIICSAGGPKELEETTVLPILLPSPVIFCLLNKVHHYVPIC